MYTIGKVHVPGFALKVILPFILLLGAVETYGSVAYKFRYYTDRDGLSSNTIQCLYQDSKGYIWVGTMDGLDRFNSHDFTNYRYDYRQPYTIENNSIYSVCAESISNPERMWVGTNNGVYVFSSRNETFARLPLEVDGVETNNVIVYTLCGDTGSNMWIGTLGAGLFRYNLKSGELEHYGTENYPDTFSTDAVNKIMLDRNNNVWIACGSSIHRYNPETNLFSSFIVEDRFTGTTISRVSAMCQDSFGDIWIAGNTSELFKFEISGFTFTSYKPEFDFGRVRAMIEYAPGTIMMGSESGLVNFNVKSRDFDHIDNGSGGKVGSLNDKFIHSIIKDRDGGVWIGTYFGGINYLSPLSSLFSTIEPSPECGRVISRMCEDTSGNIWIGSDDGGLSKYDPVSGIYRKIVFDPAHPSPNIHALLVDGPWLWIGTYGNGLYRMNLRTYETIHFSHDSGHTDNLDVYSLLRDSNGNLWIGTKRGVSLFDDETLRINRLTELSMSHDVVDIKEDFYGNIWFASLGGGLMQCDDTHKRITAFSRDSLSGVSDFVSCLLIENNNLWIGTHGNGICRYNISDKSITRDFQNTVYANCAVFQIMLSGNEIWMTTNKGLLRYNFDSPNKNIMRYTADDSLLANIFNPNSGIKASTGHIYIGCNNGINSFYPYDFTRHENSTRLSIIFPDIKLFNKSVPVAENSILRNTIDNQRSLEVVGRKISLSIDFVAINYVAPVRTIYRYKLENFDEDWIMYDGGGIQHVSYTNLRPGKYSFIVNAANGSEPYGETAAVVINIKPPLLAGRVMIFLYIMIAIGLVILAIQYISNKIKRSHQAQIESITRKNKMDILEAKVNLFTEVAHEIRTPVSLISGPLEELMKNPDMPKNIDEDINIIRKNCDRLLHLVNQILNLRSSETANTAELERGVDIKGLLETSVMQVRSAIDKSAVQLELDIPEYVVKADIYSDYFGQIITNVVSNAYKYAESHICVSLEKNVDAGETFTVKVRDDGAGIGRDDKNKIFNTFYTSSKSHSQNGLGLGLSIVRNLALKMRGSVEVDSVFGLWTEFTLKFPCSVEENAAIETAWGKDVKNFEVQTVSSDGKERPHILLLENNLDFADFFIRHISDRFLVAFASDEKEAIEILCTKNIAAIVAALDLPEVDGTRLAAEVSNNERFNHIPVIIISSDTSTDSKIRALKAGADVYLEKPLIINYIETQIEALLKNRRHLRLKFSKMPYFVINESGNLESGNNFIERVNVYITDNISNTNLSVEDIAEAVGMGRSTFFSKLKSVTGSTPNEYLRLTRLKSAAELLSVDNGLRINEISYMVGFASTSYFSKCFLAEFGLSPNEFREKYINR